MICIYLEKLVSRCPTSSPRCIPIVTMRRALQTRILKVENYEKCRLHHWKCKVEETLNLLECQSHRGNLLQSFHYEVKNRETSPRFLFSKTLIRQIWEDLFLKAMKIICSVGQDLQEHQVAPLNNCISKLQNYRTHNTDLLTLDENKFVYKKKLSMKDKVLRDTQIRNMHEMGEMKRAQELRVDEVSVQKIRENHQTIQKLTSQLQEMQEQIYSSSDSGKFQEVESNYSGGLSYVSCPSATLPSSRSMLSRDKRLPLDTWNTSGLQENVFGNQCSTFDSIRNHPQGIPLLSNTKRDRISSTGDRDLFRWR